MPSAQLDEYTGKVFFESVDILEMDGSASRARVTLQFVPDTQPPILEVIHIEER